MTILQMEVLGCSLLANAILLFNLLRYRRRANMTDAEKLADDEEQRKRIQEGW